MPPKKHAAQPTEAERVLMVQWFEKALAAAKSASPNDPARVVMPRLNHVEYNNVVRDLTGLPLDAAGAFPRDGGGGEGFQNVGETHSMSPMLVEKYLKAARWIVDHAHILPDGTLNWYGTPLRAKDPDAQYSLLAERWEALHKVFLLRMYGKRNALVQQNHGSPVVPYWQAAWRYEHRAALGKPQATFQDIAAEGPGVLNPHMLRNWHAVLTTRQAQPKWIQHLVTEWQALPPPTQGGDSTRFKDQLAKLEDWAWNHHQTNPTGNIRQKIQPYEKIAEKGDRPAEARFAQQLVEEGRYSSTILLQRLPKDTRTLHIAIGEADDGSEGDVVVFTRLAFKSPDGQERPFSEVVPSPKFEIGQGSWNGGTLKARAPFLMAFPVPSDQEELLITAELDRTEGKDGTVQILVHHDRPASLSMIPRRACMALKGNPKAEAFRSNADALRSLLNSNYVYDPGNVFTDYPGLDPAWFPKAARPTPSPGEKLLKPFRLTLAESREECTEAEATELASLARALVTLRGQKNPPAMDEAFATRTASAFAEKAWRRPLEPAENESLTTLYRASLATAASPEDALRQTLSAVLVSPHFLYRVQLSRASTQPYELSPVELANRLSFFLWASQPDAALLQAAQDGSLTRPEVLRAQARRMAADPKARALATEFAAHWLHFEGFDSFTAPDTQRFPEFKPSLRQAMHLESVLFFDDLFRNNLPVLNILHADYTFLNAELAKHYGIEGVLGPEMRRVRLPDTGGVRGGVLGMGSILTRTSKPLRTSPVLRGDWLLVYLLGTPTPPPPDDVPLLSDDEKNTEGLTLAQQLEKHRANPACQSCHEKLDPLGFAMENFDPIGRWREKMANGDPVDAQGILPGGETLNGIQALRSYLTAREDLILENFCKKLTGYALGRAVRITDKPLLDSMKQALKTGDTRFFAALDLLVTSPQFRTRRDATEDSALPVQTASAPTPKPNSLHP